LERNGIAETLEQARARTLALLEGLSEEQLSRQVSPLQSPLVWDFAHIGHFEELWLVRNVGGNPPLHAEHDDVYDAFAHARAERGELPPTPADASQTEPPTHPSTQLQPPAAQPAPPRSQPSGQTQPKPSSRPQE